jgi:hypothetical protein
MPCRPSSPIAGHSSRANQSSASILAASGAIFSSAKRGAFADHQGGFRQAEIEIRRRAHGILPGLARIRLRQRIPQPSAIDGTSRGRSSPAHPPTPLDTIDDIVGEIETSREVR